MTIKTTLNYSPNFTSKKRTSNQIKFIIFHYTGMKKESEAINRLTNIQSEVSCHYLIKNNGEIIKLVPDLYVAWHAGKSSWGSFKSLNQSSIGIEITNPGHEFSYKKFSNKQILSLLKLSKFLIKKYKISNKNILGHSDVAPERKKDPGEKFPWKYLSKNQTGLWHTLKEHELIKNRRFKISKIEKIFFLNNIFKIGYSKKTKRVLDKNRYLRDITKTFQRRFRQELVNGEIDRECLIISENLLKIYN
ncbi:N-acetylmuramoyl-L-alanine amidase [Candidatus Pelagibacter sp.]|jgi:N-acetylmuramoyl-L-alanine amidase|nr:N-acetylmuramoyl-L-alanine amidase [Candidatus Pelagibacter sp.]